MSGSDCTDNIHFESDRTDEIEITDPANLAKMYRTKGIQSPSLQIKATGGGGGGEMQKTASKNIIPSESYEFFKIWVAIKLRAQTLTAISKSKKGTFIWTLYMLET